MHDFRYDREERAEHLARHLETFVVHRLGFHEMIRIATLAHEIDDCFDHLHQHFAFNGIVRIAPEQLAQMRFAREEHRIDARREIAAAFGGNLQALFDCVGVAAIGAGGGVRHARFRHATE